MPAPETVPTLSPPSGVTRRTLIKTAAWSTPVVAASVAIPLAAASAAAPAELSYEVVALVDVDAPYGSRTLRITNRSGVDFAGPLTLTVLAWSTVPPFALPGAQYSTAGSTDTWVLPAMAIPAGQSTELPFSWTGPFPLFGEPKSLTISADPAQASVSPGARVTVTSPYQLLWIAVTPGGAGDPAGSASLFIGNTTENAFASQVTFDIPEWSAPLPAVTPVSVGGTPYTGTSVDDGAGVLVGRYDLTLAVGARDGRQQVDLDWDVPGSDPVVQQEQTLRAPTSASGETIVIRGSGRISSPSRA